jgi:phosphohistidine phosphatase
MKTVHLIRHAKSSWEHRGLADVDRPLAERGIKACRIMAQPILSAGCDFKDVYCSISQRTQLTIQGISNALPGMTIEWELEEALYTFSSRALLSWFRQLSDEMDEVVTVGHNPATTDFCNWMTNAGIPNVPTCGYAQIRFPCSIWAELSPGSGSLERFLTPKMVAQG